MLFHCCRIFYKLGVMNKKSVVKNLALLIPFAVISQSCGLLGLGGGGYDDRGELVGVPDREGWEMTIPFGMVSVPPGTFHMGQADEDVAATQINFNNTNICSFNTPNKNMI